MKHVCKIYAWPDPHDGKDRIEKIRGGLLGDYYPQSFRSTFINMHLRLISDTTFWLDLPRWVFFRLPKDLFGINYSPRSKPDHSVLRVGRKQTRWRASKKLYLVYDRVERQGERSIHIEYRRRSFDSTYLLALGPEEENIERTRTEGLLWIESEVGLHIYNFYD